MRLKPQRERGAVDQHHRRRSARASRCVAHRVRAADVPGAAGVARRRAWRRRPGTRARRGRRSAACGSRARPAARARAGARSAARGSGTSASGRRRRSRRAARPTPAPRPAAPPRPPAARRDGATSAPSCGQQAAEVDDPPHARRAPPRRANALGLAALEVHEAAAPGPPSSGSGSRRRRRRRAPRPAPRRSSRRRARGRRAAPPAAGTRSRERAKPRTAWPSRTQARDERGADVAGHAGDEGLQAAPHAPQADRLENPGDCGIAIPQTGRKSRLLRGYLREGHEDPAFCGSGARQPLQRPGRSALIAPVL